MRRVTWIPASGAPLSFDQAGDIYARAGVSGLAGMPPIRHSELVVPLQPGARWQNVSHGPRDVVVPVDLYPDPEAAMDTLTGLVDPTLGDGRIRVTRHDETERELYCRYIDALTVIEETDRLEGWVAGLVFRAVDPYWYDRTEQTIVVAPGPAPTFFPFFPLVLGASEASDSATVVNDGHVLTWPVWTLTGPGTFAGENVTRGETLTLGYDLDEGETVTIDTRPGAKSVVSSLDPDVSLFGELTPESQMWPIEVGTNELAFTVGGATAASRLTLSWRRRWLTA